MVVSHIQKANFLITQLATTNPNALHKHYAVPSIFNTKDQIKFHWYPLHIVAIEPITTTKALEDIQESLFSISLPSIFANITILDSQNWYEMEYFVTIALLAHCSLALAKKAGVNWQSGQPAGITPMCEIFFCSYVHFLCSFILSCDSAGNPKWKMRRTQRRESNKISVDSTQVSGSLWRLRGELFRFYARPLPYAQSRASHLPKDYYIPTHLCTQLSSLL